MTRQLFVALFAAILACTAQAAALFPDSSFERTGNSSEGRGGGRCLTVSSQARTRWRGSRSYKLKIEPFAQYQVVGYAKATGKGELKALLGYGWNSYDWRYQCGYTVPSDGQWHRCEVTFSCPRETYTLHPAALFGAENAQVWVDDVTIEKIAEPEAVSAAISAKKTLTMEDREFLARVHIAAAETEQATALCAGADTYTRADIYCALALASRDDVPRGKWLTKMLENSGPAYANALTRLDDIGKGRPSATVLSWLDQARASCRDGDAAMAWATATMRLGHRLLGRADTCTEAGELLLRLEQAERAAQSLLAAKQCQTRFASVLTELRQALATPRATWAKRLAALGACTITINGSALGPATHDIVLPDSPASHEEHAARQLRLYLERLTGTAPELAAVRPNPGRHGIYIARPTGDVVPKPKAKLEDLGEEAFLLQTIGPDLYILGGLRGALYGVYTLLEDYLGCGWYMPGPVGEVVPQAGAFALNDVIDLQRPSFTWRGLSSIRDAEWCIRNKVDPTISGAHYGIDKGDPAFFGTFGHNYSRLIPPGKHFLSHPEYFSLVKGKRKWDHTQLCTTNPDVIRLCAEGICRDIERRPECKVFALCQNDWAGWCECTDCKALDTRADSVTDRLMVFCSAVSKLVREQHPDKQVYTYAYQAGVEPPERVVPAPGLGIQLCHIRHPCSHSHPIETAKRNTEYKSWVEGWTDVTKQLFVYDYRVNYSNYLMPYPHSYAIIKDVPYYHRRGVRNLFYQGGGSAHNFGPCHYLLAKLMWNVTADPQELVQRFFTQYYGPAAPPMERYWKLLHGTVYEEDVEMNLYSTPPKKVFTPEFIAAAEALFEKAESRAGESVYRDRIEWERITLYWVKLATGTNPLQIRMTDKALTIGPDGRSDWRADLAEFIRIARKFRIWRIRESAWRGDVDIRGFVSEISGLDVHDRCDYRYPVKESCEGQRCVTVRANLATTPSSSWRQRYPMILKGATEHRLSCQVRTQGDATFTTIPVELTGAVPQAGQTITGETPWQEIAFTFHTPNVDSASVVAHVGRVTNGIGQVWVDDLTVVAVDAPDRNLVQNGNFERRRGTEPDYWIRPGNGSAFHWTDMSPVKEFLAAPVTYDIPGRQPRSYPVTTLENDLVRVDVIPGLGGRIQRLIDKRSGANICYNPTEVHRQEAWINYGGYEEYTSPQLGGPGWDCSFDTEQQHGKTGQKLILTAKLSDRRIRRVITLPVDRPDVRIESTVTNISANPIKARLRVHPILRIGGRVGECTLFARRRNGDVLTREIQAERSDLWLKGADFADGVWALRSSADGAGLVNRFNPTQIDTTYICVQPNEGVNLELMSPVKMLGPGDELRVNHAYHLLSPGTTPESYESLIK